MNLYLRVICFMDVALIMIAFETRFVANNCRELKY